MKKQNKTLSIRTCIGCRLRFPKSDLLRLSYDFSSEKLIISADMKRRGAYLCNSDSCFGKLYKKGNKSLSHYLKVEISKEEFERFMRSLIS